MQFVLFSIFEMINLHKRKDIHMDRIEKAKELFTSGFNCSQAVVGAYSDLFGMSAKDAMRVAEGLGGGIGRLRRTCGAVTAMAVLAGLKYSNAEPCDVKTRTLIYEKVREMVKAFEDKNGTSICGDLLGVNVSSDARPDERTAQYYKKRPCVGCVEDCAAIIEKLLLD